MPGAKSLNGISPFLIACPLSELVGARFSPIPFCFRFEYVTIAAYHGIERSYNRLRD